MRAVSFLRPCRPSQAPRLRGATTPREGGRSSAIPKDHRRPSAVSWPAALNAGPYLDLPPCPLEPLGPPGIEDSVKDGAGNVHAMGVRRDDPRNDGS